MPLSVLPWYDSRKRRLARKGDQFAGVATQCLNLPAEGAAKMLKRVEKGLEIFCVINSSVTSMSNVIAKKSCVGFHLTLQIFHSYSQVEWSNLTYRLMRAYQSKLRRVSTHREQPNMVFSSAHC